MTMTMTVTVTMKPRLRVTVDRLLHDHRALLVYNHSATDRSRLNVGISKNGVEWQNVLELESEPGEHSYPAVIQARDGRVHITYTWKRERIRHVILDPSKLP